MPARVFAPMARVFQRTFGEPGQHYWQRHDADDPDPVQLIFMPYPQEVDADGFPIVVVKPKAYVAVADALAIAPDRSALDLTLLFNNDDTLIVSGKSFAIESCKPDGLAMCELTLIRKR